MEEGDNYSKLNNNPAIPNLPEEIHPNAQPSNPDRKLRPSDVIIDESKSGYRLFKVWGPIILVIMAILLATFFGYLFWKSDLIVLEERNLIAGAEIDLVEGQTVNLNMGEDNASLKVLDKKEDSTTIKSPNGEDISIKLDEEVKIDTNGDGEDDLSIKLVRRNNGELGLFFKKIEKNINQEQKKKKVRQVIKPITEKTCSELGGVVCDKDKSYCPTKTREIKGEDCCFDTCYDLTKKCSEFGGTKVDKKEECNGTLVNASDSSLCCIVSKRKVENKTCELLKCSDDEKCSINSQTGVVECVKKICSDYSKHLCDKDEYCLGTVKSPREGLSCCEGECISLEKKCNIIQMNYCEENSCYGINKTLTDFMGNKFTCCESCNPPEKGGDSGDDFTPQCADGIDNDNDGKIDALNETRVENKIGRWFAAWNQNCNTFCSNKGLEFEPDENGDSCSSGEVVITTVVNKLGLEIYREGCWPDNCPSSGVGLDTYVKEGILKVNNFCYSQLKKDMYGTPEDNDITDIVAACHCVGYGPICSNGIDDDNDGKIDLADDGCASESDTSELPHDPDCENFEDNSE